MALFSSIDSLSRLQEDLDRFLGRPMFDFGVSGPSVFPPVNVFTNAEGWVVRAEVPGLRAENVTVEIEPRTLKVSGERPAPASSSGGFHRRERRFGKFARTIQLPADLDVNKATADVRNGVLTVVIPKAAVARPRTIPVAA